MTTLLDIKNHVKADLDLDEEDWVNDTDLTRWINEGIKSAEKQIHTLYEDYFLVESSPIAITSGSNLVDYPSDIFANKIRKIYYTEDLPTLSQNTRSHIVNRYKGDLTNAIDRDVFDSDSTDNILEWLPVNIAGTGRKIRLVPRIGRTGYLTVWYLRNALQLSADTDVLDIDEFENYIIQYTKTQAYIKDGDLRADDSKILEEQAKQDMVFTLSEMTPDYDDELNMDFSHYTDDIGSGDY